MLAYLGPAGTYCSQAAEIYLRDKKGIEQTALTSITKVIDSVNAGKYKYGIVPIENTIEGSVSTTLDKLAKNKDIYIIAEIDLPIRHQLLALPGARLNKIKEIFSHMQALEQCRDFIDKKFPNAKIIAVESTAEAASKIKQKRTLYCAAIGSRSAAKKYALAVLSPNIADYKDNMTRFAVLAKTLICPRDSAITSFIFSFRKDKPGGLHKILGFLAKQKINMTKIVSRPNKTVMGDYVFFIDIDGTPADKKVKQALKDIQNHCDFFKLLGVYRRNAKC
jgi:prephenate dehydratase